MSISYSRKANQQLHIFCNDEMIQDHLKTFPFITLQKIIFDNKPRPFHCLTHQYNNVKVIPDVGPPSTLIN